MSYTIRAAIFPEERAAVRGLFEQYQSELGVDLCFQNFAAELRDLPGSYAEPAGLLLIGCVALKALNATTAEMKRLYVEPGHRGTGIARQLVLELVDRARGKHYSSIVLDTLPTMSRAQRLYVSLGFTDVAAYTYNPIAGVRYMALAINQSAAPCRDHA
jgi:ribosomal protein S18 acetylase RimI-like enzyme